MVSAEPRRWEIPLTPLVPPLSLNHRMHYRPKAALTAQLRQEAGWRARAMRIPQLERGKVTLIWTVNTRHRRDPINMSPTTKALVDGLVDAKVFSDDDHTRVKQDQEIEYGDKMSCRLVIEEVA